MKPSVPMQSAPQPAHASRTQAVGSEAGGATVLHRPQREPLSDFPSWCRADAVGHPKSFLQACPPYQATPLHRLAGLSAELKLGSIHLKDESSRLNLASFKALGGAYAVLRVAQRRAETLLGRAISPDMLTDPAVRTVMQELVICCASDGNHGRSVAAGARLVGAKCVVFLHAGVSGERAAHIAHLGAEVRRVLGSYEDSVELCRRIARAENWLIIADTAEPQDIEGAEACGFVMQGYTVLLDEILEAATRQAVSFTHVFVQAGVGGLAASLFGHWTARMPGAQLPRFFVVEPVRSPCLFESARSGQPVRLPHVEPTVMAMLECQRPSALAWPVVKALTEGYVLVSEEEAVSAVQMLASPQSGDVPLEIGESGAAGLAGLTHLCSQKHWRDTFGLDEKAHALLIGTEGLTDRSLWTGRRPRPNSTTYTY